LTPVPRGARVTGTAGSNRDAAQTVAPASRFTLELSGLGRSQASVSQFILRLEQLELFERVTILKTGREMFGEHESIGFRIEATIGAPASTASRGEGGAQ
jgi:hypothetical protein